MSSFVADYFHFSSKENLDLVALIQQYHKTEIKIDYVLERLGSETLDRMFIDHLYKFSLQFHHLDLLKFALDKEIEFLLSEGRHADETIIHIVNKMVWHNWKDIEISSILSNKKLNPINNLDQCTDKTLSFILPHLTADMRQKVFDLIVLKKDYLHNYRKSVQACIILGIQKETLFGESIRNRELDIVLMILTNLKGSITSDMVKDIIHTGDSKLLHFCFQDANAYQELLNIAKNDPTTLSARITEDVALCGMIEVELSEDINISTSLRDAVDPLMDRCYNDMKKIDFFMLNDSKEHIQLIKKNAILVYFEAIADEVREKFGIQPASAVRIWYKYEAEGHWSE
jgi:hypothetical protein